MDIIITMRSDKPIYEQIESQLKEMIVSQKLKAGDPIPSMRALAKDLHISLITVKKAYENLSRDGLIETIVGKGSFVASLNTEQLKEEKQREIEALLSKACQEAKAAGIRKDTLKELIDILYEGELL
ncbi:GntR family transcriptional regulator [Dubosiella newyorkensis]|jgi:GntR family transcriptional regulator|uniref:GntR family transcriptional regulator n=1 Tax=Dubosiella newyorkensis TaxID=1862672 RepID=UPI0023536976|nr:GntR family transcriptional regulator [Dubosiella newyorkensis]MCI9041450.1 GntR family transcriptional regulator [Dubosiella newyorkensis]